MLRRSLYGVFSDGRVLGLFVPLPQAVLTGFLQGTKISLEAGFGRIVFLRAVFIVFHSWYKSTLIPVPPSIGLCDFKGFILTHCFLVLRDESSPGPYTQCGIGVPSEIAAVRWSCFAGRSALLPMRRALSPRKSGTFSFMLPYSRDVMFVYISLDCVGSLIPLWGTLVSPPRPISSCFPIHEG